MATPTPSPVRVALSLLSLCIAGALLGVSPASAQNRAPAMRAPVQVHQTARVAPTRPQSAHILSAVPVVRPPDGQTADHTQNRTAMRTFPHSRTNGDHSFQNQFGCAFGTSAQQLLSPVPPYGFNYEYLNAINKDLNVKAAIDPATQLALREAARFGCTGIAGSGYILWDGASYAPAEQREAQPQESVSASQPQIIVVQVPAAAQQVELARTSAESRPLEEQAPPLPDIGQFTLVMRDGTQLKAAAFTRSNDQIIYITPDGMRHTIAVTDLDADATLRLNSERGSQLQLSL